MQKKFLALSWSAAMIEVSAPLRTAQRDARMSTSLVLSLALIVVAPALKDPPAKPRSIEGEWCLVERTVGGKQQVLETGPNNSPIVISTEKWVLNQGSAAPSKWDLQLDPSARPVRITLFKPDGGRKQNGMVGIYKVEGATLTICYVFDGVRPTAFESSAGTEIRIMILKRVVEK
ncbi:MAG: TIGR03067 domain-containing protein [Gemmataceae bacterium]|nr:TIGR03067 domain-containing protein [Gemmataceae bacterium]